MSPYRNPNCLITVYARKMIMSGTREASETSLCRHTMTFLVPLAMLPPNDACCTNLESSALLLECPCIVVVSSAVLVLLLVVHKIHVAIPMLWRSRFTSASHSPSWSRT